MEIKAFTYRLLGFAAGLLLLQMIIPSVIFSAPTPVDITEPSEQRIRSMQQYPTSGIKAVDMCCKDSIQFEYQPSGGFPCKTDLSCALHNCGATNSARKAIISPKIPVDYISPSGKQPQRKIQQYLIQSRREDPSSVLSSTIFLLNCVFLN